MVNKLVVSLILILMILGIAIYFRVEFKYAMVANNRNSLYLRDLNNALNSTKNDNTSKQDKVISVMEKNGIKFSTDYILVEDYLYKSCEPNCLTSLSFYENYEKLINQVQVKRLWVVKHNQLKDKVAYFIQDKEEKQFKENFLKRREYISNQYKNINELDLKQKSLNLIKSIDAKLAELNKK